MNETTKGLSVKDYHDIEPIALEEIVQLDEQLVKQLSKLKSWIRLGEISVAVENIDEIISSTREHIKYAQHCTEDIIEGMMNPPEESGTPCDYPDNDGHYTCPYDANGGDDCRNYCGLGVDE